MRTTAEDTAPRQLGGLSRRSMLAGGLFTALGATVLAAADPASADPGDGSTPPVAPNVITPEQFGCAGDGTTDDAAAMQAALDSLTAGQTLRFQQGATYNTSTTWVVSTDNVTIDVNRATVRAHTTRNGDGGNGLTGDTYIVLNGVTGVRLLDGVLGAPLSPAGQCGDQLQMINCTDSVVQGWTVSAAAYTPGSNAIIDRNGTNCAIRDNHVSGGGVAQIGAAYCVIEHNKIVNSPQDHDAIGSFGYTSNPSSNTIIRWNLIRNYGRIGIEDYSPDNDRNAILETKIYGNRIETYTGSGDAGQGISAMGASSVIHDNEVLDASGWGIEATADGVAVNHNKLLWSTLAAGAGNTGIVFNTTTTATGRVVNQCIGNEIHQAQIGIQAYQSTGGLTSAISVVGNIISESRRSGIDVSSSSGSTVTGNIVQWLAPGPDGQSRIGIQPGPNSRNVGNTIILGANSGQAGVWDTPWLYTAPKASYVSNVVDANNRSVGQVMSGGFGQPADGSRFVDDRHMNGATRSLSSLTNVVTDALPGVATQTLTSAGTVTIDAAGADTQTVTLQGNCTAMTIVNPTPGKRLRIVLVQDAKGGRSVKWCPSIKFNGGVPPVATLAANKRDSVVVEYDANGYWYEVSRALKM